MDERVRPGEALNGHASMSPAPTERMLRDQSGRDLIVTELDRNMMVLAGAGAGKTHALIERMVAGVRSGTTRVDQMAAITFTRKAAGEMRGRFVLRLRKAAQEVESSVERRRIDAALRSVDQCFIGTIHAFCGRLLRERPLDAGLSPDFSEIDDREEALIRREAWDQFVQELFARSDPRISQLESFGLEPEDLFHFFGRRCQFADLPLKPTETPRPDLGPATGEVMRFVSAVWPRIPPAPEKRDALMQALRKARHFLSNHGIRSDADRATILGFFDRGLKVTLKHWGEDRAFATTLRDELLPQLQENIIGPALRRWREAAYGVVAELVDDAMDSYDARRLQRGTLTFQDLLLCTEALLRASPEVRAYFAKRYRTLLVDEFQDTDPVQAAIVMYLTSDDPSETDWRKIRPRPGSLFLVGDDKQSIYRFRRADVEVFREMCDRIRDTGGEIIHLNTSFRSYGSLCRWISSSFPAAFEQPPPPYQARFEPLFEYRPDGLDATCVRKISIPPVHKHRREEILSYDASRIAAFIAIAIEGRTSLNSDRPDAVLGRVASPGDFMILTRTATQIGEYARRLEAVGVPYDIVGGGRISESSEFRALLSVLETIYAPDNPVPLLNFLRGPLVGLSDGELYDFRRAGGSFHYEAELPDELDLDLLNRLKIAQRLLHDAEEALTTRPAAAAIEYILESTGLLAYAGVHPDGRSSSRAGSLLRVLALARDLHARGRHWGEIIEELIQLRDDPAYNLEEMTLEAGRDDVVRLMNVHQAKGLQAKVVFLADPYDCSPERYKPESHVSRHGDSPFLSMIVAKRRGDYGSTIVAQPSGWEQDCEEEERFEAAEEVRLLYVAATRARNLLVVSHYTGRIDRGPWHPLYRYLDEMPELEVAGEAAHRDGLARSDSPGLEWTDLRREITARFVEASRPSYDIRAVTDETAADVLERDARVGRGRDYGVVIHRLLEHAVHRRLPDDVEGYVKQTVSEAGLDPGYVPDAVEALRRFRSSEIWKEISVADRVYTEVPLGRLETVSHEITRGVIDLAYRLNGSWRIVDYKTDPAATREESEQLRQKYAHQVKAYKRYWEDITGEKVSSADIWLAHGPSGSAQLTLFQI